MWLGVPLLPCYQEGGEHSVVVQPETTYRESAPGGGTAGEVKEAALIEKASCAFYDHDQQLEKP